MPVTALLVAMVLAQSLSAAGAPSAGAVLLAQDEDRLEEDFGDPPPPPPLELDDEESEGGPVGEAPVLPPPVVEDSPSRPDSDRQDRERSGPRDGDDSEMDPMVTRAAQYGAGLGTLALCTGGGVGGICCGLLCLSGPISSVAFSLPLLAPCLMAASYVALGGAAGAAAGAVEGVLGQVLSEEEEGILWPTVATAGAGAGVMALIGGASLASAVFSPTFTTTPSPINANVQTPVACLFTGLSFALCGAYCVGVPLVGVLTYGATARPAAPEQTDREVMLKPAASVAVTAMAF